MISSLQPLNGFATHSVTGFDPLTNSGNGGQGDTPFADLLKDVVGNASRLENEARTSVDGLMTGSGVDVHQAMIASEKASMVFELMLAVRNKAIQSYQSVMNMQF